MKVILYTTLGCHLCEEALELIHQLPSLQQSELAGSPVTVRSGSKKIDLQEIDIAESTDLMAEYGIRIPVVKRESVDSDLGWPFTLAQLAEYLDMGS